ncbi:hypothetical protein [Streptomyces sp. NEAU-S77]
MNAVLPRQLRARFARALSDAYAREAPGHATLVDVAARVDAD